VRSHYLKYALMLVLVVALSEVCNAITINMLILGHHAKF